MENNLYNYNYEVTTTSGEGMSAGAVVFLVLIMLAVAALIIAATWRVFTKAGKPGWAAIVPIYNSYIIIKIAGRPGWWLVLFFIPFVNIIVNLIVLYDVAKAFGKDVGYMLLLAFLPIIGWPLLAWGKATYKKPKGA